MSSFACGAIFSLILEPLQGTLERAVGNVGDAVFSFLQNCVVDLLFLSRNAAILDREMGELRRIRNDMVRDVEIEEVEGLVQCTDQVKGWVERVDALDTTVSEFQTLFSNRRFLDQVRLFSQLGDKLKDVRESRNQRNGITVLVSKKLPDAVMEVPSTSATSIVGGEETLLEILDYLQDDNVGIIGVYGMGGIGKTTLLRKINNDFVKTGTQGKFDVVIWAKVSQDLSIVKLQKDIGNRVGLSFSMDRSANLPYQVEEQANILFRTLSKKKFLLFLDDVWEMLDLVVIGIPAPDVRNKCKLVFTTRSEDVCSDMAAEAKIKVKLLDERQSWELFRRNLGADEVLGDPLIRPLATNVIANCGGLPMTLITVARAMANKRRTSEWKNAIKALEDNAIELRGMEKRVLYQLKFSYDYLENDTLRVCLLYCSMFPEDHEIHREQLIDYLIGEGLLDNKKYIDAHIDDVRNRGHVLITNLQAACLLEDGDADEDNKVKLHDTVRDMALWLTDDGCDKGNKFLVHAGRQWSQVLGVERWGEARRISLMFNAIEVLPNETPDCPNLQMLLLNWNFCTFTIPSRFFSTIRALRVLDLSYSPIESIPTSIGFLVELQYLNLAGTMIESLPKELGKLVKLRQLNLSFASRLSSIPRESISVLPKLQMLHLHCISWDWKWGDDGEQQEERQLSLRDVEGLEQLNELKLDISTIISLERLLSSNRLSRSMKILYLKSPEGLTTRHLSSAFGIMADLEEIIIQSSQILFTEDITLSLDRATIVLVGPSKRGGASFPLQSLRRLYLGQCNGMRDLTWVRQLPCLQHLEVQFCEDIEELIVVEEGAGNDFDDFFPKLQKMDLFHLPRFRSISRHLMLLPSLQFLTVVKCPELKKLPLRLDSAKKIQEIWGEQKWWDQLEWEQGDEDRVKLNFLLYFNSAPESDGGDEGEDNM